MVSKGTIGYIEGCTLLETNETVISDYRSYLFDINLKNILVKSLVYRIK